MQYCWPKILQYIAIKLSLPLLVVMVMVFCQNVCFHIRTNTFVIMIHFYISKRNIILFNERICNLTIMAQQQFKMTGWNQFLDVMMISNQGSGMMIYIHGHFDGEDGELLLLLFSMFVFFFTICFLL
jgi:hypothetical protein